MFCNSSQSPPNVNIMISFVSSKPFVTHPSLLQTSILWCLLSLQSLSQTFNANVMWAPCAKVVTERVFCKHRFSYWFRSKSVIRKLSTSVEACFSDRPFFLTKNIEILRNLNHYQICKEEKKKLQTITDKNNETLEDFSIGSICHKYSGTWYLVQETLYTRCLTSCRTI